jgi:hypothetical protein
MAQSISPEAERWAAPHIAYEWAGDGELDSLLGWLRKLEPGPESDLARMKVLAALGDSYDEQRIARGRELLDELWRPQVDMVNFERSWLFFGTEDSALPATGIVRLFAADPTGMWEKIAEAVAPEHQEAFIGAAAEADAPATARHINANLKLMSPETIYDFARQWSQEDPRSGAIFLQEHADFLQSPETGRPELFHEKVSEIASHWSVTEPDAALKFLKNTGADEKAIASLRDRIKTRAHFPHTPPN